MPSRRPGDYGRGSLVALLVAAHAGVIAVAIAGSPTQAVPQLPAITVSAVSEAKTVVAAIEPKLVHLEPRVDEPRVDVADEAPPVAPMVLAATSSGNGCSVTEEVQATLRASNDVHAALDRIPRAARSVANAVLLWNGRWIDANEVGGPGAIDPIRAAVAAVVHTASADCRTAQVTGPRFMIVPSPSGTRILTFGSGDWTWAEVAAG